MTVKEMLVESLQAKGFDGLCNDEGCCCSIENYGLVSCCCDYFNVMDCEPGHESRCYDKECDCQGFHISAEKPKKPGAGDKEEFYGAIVEVGRCEEPAEGRECPEAVYSQGRACKRCDVASCYRKGWAKLTVDADNQRLCLQTQKARRL